jgi:hypothetical protein
MDSAGQQKGSNLGRHRMPDRRRVEARSSPIQQNALSGVHAGAPGIETISSYISCNPPETSGELLKLRELQRKYREIAESIKKEIVKLG